MKRIAIIGPGAMGCLFAYFLKPVFEELVLIDYLPERAELLNQKGIQIETSQGIKKTQIKATAQPEEIGIVDLVLVCVKAYSTRTALERAQKIAGENTLVLSLQNGLGNLEAISAIVDKKQILGGTTAMGANLVEPGFIRFAGEGETVIGELEGKGERAERVAELFRTAGLEVKTTANLQGTIWSKVLINVGINALTALLRVRNGRLLYFSESKSLLHQAVKEAEQVAKAKGIELLYPDAIAKVEEVARRTGENISSMLQDVRAKRKTEIDAINGAIVREGEKLGISCPVNQVLTLLVKALEASYDEQLI